MKYYLLDGVGGAFLLVLFGLGLLFIIVAVFLEAWIIYKMKFTAAFNRALLFSFVANIISMAAGLILSNADAELFHLNNIQGFAIMFVTTVILEFVILYLLNKQSPLKRTLWVCTAMNLVTYTIAAILILIIFN